jgi:hypothetical protein
MDPGGSNEVMVWRNNLEFGELLSLSESPWSSSQGSHSSQPYSVSSRDGLNSHHWKKLGDVPIVVGVLEFGWGKRRRFASIQKPRTKDDDEGRLRKSCDKMELSAVGLHPQRSAVSMGEHSQSHGALIDAQNGRRPASEYGISDSTPMPALSWSFS